EGGGAAAGGRGERREPGGGPEGGGRGGGGPRRGARAADGGGEEGREGLVGEGVEDVGEARLGGERHRPRLVAPEAPGAEHALDVEGRGNERQDGGGRPLPPAVHARRQRAAGSVKTASGTLAGTARSESTSVPRPPTTPGGGGSSPPP